MSKFDENRLTQKRKFAREVEVKQSTNSWLFYFLILNLSLDNRCILRQNVAVRLSTKNVQFHNSTCALFYHHHKHSCTVHFFCRSVFFDLTFIFTIKFPSCYPCICHLSDRQSAVPGLLLITTDSLMFTPSDSSTAAMDHMHLLLPFTQLRSIAAYADHSVMYFTRRDL